MLPGWSVASAVAQGVWPVHQAQSEMLSGVKVTGRLLSHLCWPCIPPTCGCGLVWVWPLWMWPRVGVACRSLKVCLGAVYSLPVTQLSTRYPQGFGEYRDSNRHPENRAGSVRLRGHLLRYPRSSMRGSRASTNWGADGMLGQRKVRR